MEILQELLFTVGFSLLVSFAIAKLFSMASSSDQNTSVSVSVVSVINEQVFCDRNNNEKLSVVQDFEIDRTAVSADVAVKFSELEEGEESRAETIGSRLKRDDSEIDVVLRKDTVTETGNFREIGIESADVAVSGREIKIESEEVVGVLESEDVVEEGEGLLFDDDDDWEGIERTELEKRFGDAVVFVGSKSNADSILSIDSDTKMQLHGLHKVAIDGPCRVPQPMALKVSARAKWNAWQQLGDMSRELAMEQYLTLLTRSIPGWMGDMKKDGKQISSNTGSSTNLPSDLHKQSDIENESMLEELKPCNEDSGMIGVDHSDIINREKE